MNKKLSFFLVSWLIVAFSCVNRNLTAGFSAHTPRADSLLLNERARLKKYALCKCLALSFPSDEYLVSDGSLMGYIEVGSYSNQAYAIIDSFASIKLAVKYSSKDHHNLYLMKCIDIYNSVELDSIVNSLDQYLNRKGDQNPFTK